MIYKAPWRIEKSMCIHTPNVFSCLLCLLCTHRFSDTSLLFSFGPFLFSWYILHMSLNIVLCLLVLLVVFFCDMFSPWLNPIQVWLVYIFVFRRNDKMLNHWKQAILIIHLLNLSWTVHLTFCWRTSDHLCSRHTVVYVHCAEETLASLTIRLSVFSRGSYELQAITGALVDEAFILYSPWYAHSSCEFWELKLNRMRREEVVRSSPRSSYTGVFRGGFKHFMMMMMMAWAR